MTMMYVVPDMAPPSEAPHPGEYTIDELASAARVPSRTIRFYQSRGALMAPEIRGRVAYYGATHLERLKLIAQLQDRGLRMDAIRDLVLSIDRGEVDLAEWLGVERELQTSWAHDQPRTVSEAELLALAANDRPGLVSDLVRFGLVERRDDVYLVESPSLLGIAMRLEAAGIDLTTARAAADIVKKHVGRAVSDLIELFMKRASSGELGASDPAKVLETLRPLGLEAVRVIFGRAMERGLRQLVESGALAVLPRKARRESRREARKERRR
jgi:DNA-binding transcriptional MerR regulator